MAEQSRVDLDMKNLKWVRQPTTTNKHRELKQIRSSCPIEKLASQDEFIFHIKAFDLPKQPKRLVLDSRGIVALGTKLADAFSAE